MKTIKRRLLSLVLAMAMVLTLAPGALAANELTVSVTVSNASQNAVDGKYPIGTIVTLTANVTAGYTDESTDGSLTYSWSGTTSSSNTATVTLNSATTINVSCTISATKDGTTKSGTGTLQLTAADSTPQDKPVTAITLNKTTLSLEKGKSETLSVASWTPTDATNKTVTWNSSDSSAVSVDQNGKVTGNRATTSPVTITATASGAATGSSPVTATCQVTVTEPTAKPVTGITLAPASKTLVVGEKFTLTPTVTPADATNKTVTWSTANPAVATVNNGEVTAAGEGTTTITATAADGSGIKGECSVTVTKNTVATIPVSLNAYSLAAGQTTYAIANFGALVYGTDYDYVNWTSSSSAATITFTNNNNRNMANITAVSAGTPTFTVQLKKGGVSGTLVAQGTSSALTIKGASVYISTTVNGSAATYCDLAGYGSTAILYAHIPSGYTNPVYVWSLATNGDKVIYAPTNNYSYSSLNIQAVAPGQTTVYLSVYQNTASANNLIGSTSITINVGKNGLQPSVTVSGYNDYVLSERDSTGKSSVVDQIASMVNNYSGRYLHSVVFSTTTSTYGDLSARTNTTYYADGISSSNGGRLSDVVFSPRQIGKATFNFIAYYTYGSGSAQYNDSLSGVLTIEVKDGVSSSGDITYTADLGKDVAFDLRDFEDYYYNKTRGTLSYVTFTLPSGGTLYYDGGRLPSSNSCYASPSRTQIDLAGIYFTPTGTTATRPGSVRISFTAYGSRNYSGGTSGTVVINYLSGSAKDITYTPSGKSVSLRAIDFTEAYRQAVGSTAPSGLTIQFQDVPSYGTLTYKDSSRSNSSTVTLRSSNIKNYKFTTRSSGSNQLADVTYTPSGSRNESITYIAYNGNTPQFTGKVVFNPTVVDNNMSVTFTGGQTITLDYQRFVQANASVMASTTRIRFMSLPVYGTLTYNGATVSAAGTDIVPSLLGNVVYRSSSATTVTDKVVFTCYNAAGDVVGGGQVNLNSTGTGGNNGGVTNISQFKDVNPNAWYASDLSILLSRGIMQGKLEGKFDPLGQLKYGEALKIFLLSAGYSAQEGTGKDWAAGYKTLAVNNGWISSDVDLDAKITRNAMAELAAKVLGLSATSSVPPAWKDGTSNGYANALYYTSPQILVGNADGTFKGNDTLQRQEICKIAARVLNYKSNQQSSQLPGWLLS